ncbi:hypothetical protein M2163_000734 [Streptomyces sp. SAI-135]|uniref:hypothetical protein n=1 Tax=unclassified Streptomyces TaxID=2593676 RepID=UPI0024746936|nr:MULTISPECIES: hypothetical protein [unclassified Streptomyces]MDH6522759.1 hypothetical protein [Streptomyces sp. SAI-090]MDH6613626.1 hypothetical protein [Streptomyces sp. SAI-135]
MLPTFEAGVDLDAKHHVSVYQWVPGWPFAVSGKAPSGDLAQQSGKFTVEVE